MSKKFGTVFGILAAAAIAVGWVSTAAAAQKQNTPEIVSVSDHIDDRGVAYREATTSDGTSYQFGWYQIANYTPGMSVEDIIRTAG